MRAFAAITVVAGLLLLCGCPAEDEPGGDRTESSRERATDGGGTATPEDGSSPRIVTPDGATDGVSVVLILDTSGSMSGNRIRTVMRVMRNTIGEQLRIYDVMSEGALDVSLLRFGRRGYRIDALRPMGPHDEEAFDQAIGRLSAGGNTPLGEALRSALRQLKRSSREDRHVFVLSDGMSNGHVPVPRAIRSIHAWDPKVAFHVIGFQAQRSYYQPFEAAGGQVVMAENGAALREACREVFEVILEAPEEE